MAEFLLPDLGEGLTNAEVLRWMVQVGDEVAIDQPVVEVDTAKAAVEVPIPFAGTVTALLVEEGQLADVGQPLIRVETASPSTASGSAPPTGFREPGVTTAAEGSGNVLIGYGTPGESAGRRRRKRVPEPAAQAVPAEPATVAAPTATVPAPQPIQMRGVISPVVRRLARDAGIDLAGVTPADGEVIRRADVERAIAARHQQMPSRPPGAAAGAGVASGAGDAAGVQRIPLTGPRAFMADKLSRSRREIPEATVWVDVDATKLLEARRELATADQPVSVLALLSRFVVAGLRRYPQLNARVENDVIEQYDAINLGFAAQTERGLVVPVVHGAEAMSLRQLGAAMSARTEQARSGALGAAELSGGTFTVNNYGVFGVDGSAAIINHPEAAILGMGRIIDRPWVVDGEIAVRKVAQLTIAFDHRVCDGGVAGGFLRYVADCVESPVSVLADL